jgi:hypothetical protein
VDWTELVSAESHGILLVGRKAIAELGIRAVGTGNTAPWPYDPLARMGRAVPDAGGACALTIEHRCGLASVCGIHGNKMRGWASPCGRSSASHHM